MKRLIFSLAILLAAAAVTPAMAATDGVSAPQSEQIAVKPQPGSLELIVRPAADSPVRFDVFGITGQLVQSVSLESGEVRTIDLGKGCYIVRAVAPDGKTLSKRYNVQ